MLSMTKTALICFTYTYILFVQTEARKLLGKREALPQEPPAPPGREKGPGPPGPPGQPRPPGQRLPEPTTTVTTTLQPTTSTTSTFSALPTFSPPATSSPPVASPSPITSSSATSPASSPASSSQLPTFSQPATFSPSNIVSTSPPIQFTSTATPLLSQISTEIATPTSLGTTSPISSDSIVSSSTSPVFSTTSIPVTGSISSPVVFSTTVARYPSMSDFAPIESPTMSNIGRPQNTLTIVLSVVLGSVALLLGTLIFFVMSRWKRRRSIKRGVSPINDEEIESWRGTEKKLSLSVATRPFEADRKTALIPLSPESQRSPTKSPFSPGWDWTHPNVPQIQSPPPTRSRGPSLVATAPNARFGLTTDAVPGADAYVPVLKSQSSRISRDRNHARSKSMRSSASAKSMRSLHEESVAGFDFTMNLGESMHWLPYEHKDIADVSTLGGTNSPGTSIFGATSEDASFSPRSRPVPLDNLDHLTALSPRPEQPHWSSARSPLESPSNWPKSWR